LGYCVSRGETAIRIWAPCPPSSKQLERWKQNGADPDQRPRTFFKLTAVFDRLSRVRSGDVANARVGPGSSARGSRRCSSSRRRMWEAAGFCLRGRRGPGARRATAQRRSRARLSDTRASANGPDPCSIRGETCRPGRSLQPFADEGRTGVDADQLGAPRSVVRELVRHARGHDHDIAGTDGE
jgi:hypothetical protein